MDIRKELEVVRRTGEYSLGSRQTLLLMLNKKAKVVVLARDCPPDKRRELLLAGRVNGIKVIESSLSSREIGLALGKPFSAAAVAITDVGSSSLAAEEEQA